MDSEIFETKEDFIKKLLFLKKSYKTSNILTKYEKTKILSERRQQLNNGSISYIKDIQSNNIYEMFFKYNPNEINFIIKSQYQIVLNIGN